MEQLYNEYSMNFINQGEERARLDCCVRAIERNMATVSEAAEAFGVDETKLVNYIKTCKGNNPN